jgi:hypothetical protein
LNSFAQPATRLDANVALKWVLNEPLTAQAIQLRDEYRQQLHELLSPDVFPIEVALAIYRPTIPMIQRAQD